MSFQNADSQIVGSLLDLFDIFKTAVDHDDCYVLLQVCGEVISEMIGFVDSILGLIDSSKDAINQKELLEMAIKISEVVSDTIQIRIKKFKLRQDMSYAIGS